jgi:hypothetical protein
MPNHGSSNNGHVHLTLSIASSDSDIKIGEELTCDYDYFDTDWDLFGLQ